MQKTNIKNIFILASLFFTALSLFGHEILITRLFSVILSSNLVSFVVSFSILGMGIGGILTYWGLKRVKSLELQKIMQVASFALPLSILICVMIIYLLPFIPLYIFYVVIGSIPFVFGGSVVSAIFQYHSLQSSKLYFMDLVGSALGSIFIIYLLNTLGFMYSMLIIVLIAFIGAILLASYFGARKKIFVQITFIIALIGLLVQGQYVKDIENKFHSYYTSYSSAINYLKNTTDKPMGIFYTNWNAMSRTDVIETTNEKEKLIVTDGGASAPIIKFDGDLNKVDYLKKDINYIPFSFGQNEDTLLIGSGGGKDVLFALMAESKNIDAVEINPATIDAVNYFKEYNGDIYGRPEVNLHQQDGRNFIENTKKVYNNIYFSMVMTNSVENATYSLAENYLFTQEAFERYFSSLKPQGKVSLMVHNPLEMVRVVNTGIKVLLDKGVNLSEVTDYFVIINGVSKQQKMAHGNSISMPLIIFKNEPFGFKEITSIKSVAEIQGRDLIHYTGNEYGPYNQLGNGGFSYKDLIKSFEPNVKPVSDRSPFFYDFSYFISSKVAIILIGFILLWLIVKRKSITTYYSKIYSRYFILIGVAFMLVEIPFIQKATLYFGSSSMAFSSVLFSVLIASGLGSLFSGYRAVMRLIENKPIYLLLTSISVIYTLVVFNQVALLAYDLNIFFKFISVFFILLPMGIFMGMPFPIGLKQIKKRIADEEIVPLMWGINGIFSVIGSVLTIIISMKSSLDISIILGALCYIALYILDPFKKLNLEKDK